MRLGTSGYQSLQVELWAGPLLLPHSHTLSAVCHCALPLQIAAAAPTTEQAVTDLVVSGLSMHMKKSLAKYVVGAVQQADAFLKLVEQGVVQLGDFQLDTMDMFAEVRQQGWQAGRRLAREGEPEQWLLG